MALQEVSIKLNAQQLSVVYAGLDELPGKISREVYGAILKQVVEQVAASEAKPPDASQT